MSFFVRVESYIRRGIASGGVFICEHHMEETDAQESFCHRICDLYRYHPDIRVTYSNGEILKDFDDQLFYQPEHPAVQFLYNLVRPSSIPSEWGPAYVYYNSEWIWLGSKYGHEIWEDGFYLCFSREKPRLGRETFPGCSQWTFDRSLEKLCQRSRGRYGRDLIKVPQHLWKTL